MPRKTVKVIEHKPENPLGYTQQEVEKMCQANKIPVKGFWMEFGVNTCPILPGGTPGFYTWDVVSTIQRMKEGRKQSFWEWD